MKTTILTLAAIVIYIAIAIFTYWACTPKNVKQTQIDKILIPLVALFWPIPWLFTLGNEVVGFFRRKIANYQRTKRIKRKQEKNQERLKNMNQ